MAVPSNPTVSSIVTEGLKRGGIVNPTAGQITDATDHQLQEVKTDISAFAGDHPYLQSNEVITATVGQSQYDWPSTANTIRSVTRLEATDEERGTAQAGAATTITLATTFSRNALDVEGRYLVTTGGTGVNQIRQVTDWNDTTKVATIDTAWATNPDSSTTYAVISSHQPIPIVSKTADWDREVTPYNLADPTCVALVGQQLWFNKAPDRQYVFWVDFVVDLDQLDETGTLFVRLLREWRSLWIQGIATKVMQRYDDIRYNDELRVYNSLLQALGGRASTIGHMRWFDV